MFQRLIQNVEVEIHVRMGVFWLRVDFVEAIFFVLHPNKFDVTIAFF